MRREKEISETKAEALETESMRYRQRAEHLQRDLDETKSALELEFERTKGRMLTEVEYKEMMEKVKKAKEYELLNKEMEKQKNIEMTKNKALLEKVCLNFPSFFFYLIELSLLLKIIYVVKSVT